MNEKQKKQIEEFHTKFMDFICEFQDFQPEIILAVLVGFISTSICQTDCPEEYLKRLGSVVYSLTTKRDMDKENE